MPLLSIIIPAYNSERFISHTLSMLVSQGLDECEVIVINDGSTDQTGNIIESFAKEYKEMKIISIQNSGVSVARNTGIKKATGKYIYFLDSDDTLAPDTLSFYKKTIRDNTSIDIYAFGYKSCVNGKNKKKYTNQQYSKNQFDNAKLFLILFFSRYIYCNISSVIISCTLLKETNIFFTPGLKIGEDLKFLIEIIYQAKTVYYDARICFIYQIRGDSTMQGYKTYSKEQFEYFVMQKNVILGMINENPSISRNAHFFLANIYCYNLRSYLKSNCKNKCINQGFLLNKKLLLADISGNMINYLFIFAVMHIPIKILLFVFGKYENCILHPVS